MTLHRVAVVTILNLAAVSAGCGQSREGYVDFGQTAPSELDLTAQPSAGSPTPGPEGENKTAQTSSSETIAAGTAASQSGTSSPVTENGDTAPKPASITIATAETSAAGSSDNSNTAAGVDSPKVDAKNSGTTKPLMTAEPSDKPGGGELIVSPQSGLLGPADMPVVENSTTSEPRKIELLIPEHHLRKERGTDAVRVTYDDIDLLKVLNMEPVPVDAVEHFPEWLKSLNGKPVRIRGFMYPTFEASGLTRFTLARDNGICCFVRQPKIYDIIGIELAGGITTDYIEGRPFDVEGTFHIEPMADEKDLSRLYRIDNARVLH